MTLTILKSALFCLALGFGAYKDIKTKEIPDAVPALIFALGIIGFSPIFSILGLLLTGLPFLIAAVVSKGKMGGGDIKLMAACGFLLGVWGGMIQTIVGLSAALLFVGVRAIIKKRPVSKEEGIRLAPFLGLGGVVAFVVTNFI